LSAVQAINRQEAVASEGRLRISPTVNIRTEEEAVAAYTSYLGNNLPEGTHVAARCVIDGLLPDDGCIWAVSAGSGNLEDVVPRGYLEYLGPDGKVWRFPSSLIFPDHDFAVTALVLIYCEGVADQVDQYALVGRVAAVMNQRDLALSALVEDAKEGRLRHPPQQV
jgi:hypothetical protein